jgi:MoaA/NifB/PqqE/SkfB family radical SAM enzyme
MPFKSLETDQVGTGRLRAVEIGVTARCNFRCSYCGAYALLDKRVLSSQDVINTLENLSDLERVKLSGGEVLIQCQTCVEIVDYCTGRGVQTQLNTNGTLLTEERLAQLEEVGLDIVHFSLNHTDAASHSRFYRVHERQFGKIVDAIERTVASPSVEAVAETILFNETQKTLPDIHRYVADLGVPHHEIQMEIPSVHQGYESTLGLDEVTEAISAVVQARDPRTTLYFSCLSAYFGSASPSWAVLQPLFTDPGVVYASCIEGKAQLHIHSTGEVMICELGCPEIIGNIFEDDLLTLYEAPDSRLQEFIKKKHEDQTFSCFRHCDSPAEPQQQLLSIGRF